MVECTDLRMRHELCIHALIWLVVELEELLGHSEMWEEGGNWPTELGFVQTYSVVT
jgi:hypothetical protein